MPHLTHDLAPELAQGETSYCWAAALICAARYHDYPSVRGITTATALRECLDELRYNDAPGSPYKITRLARKWGIRINKSLSQRSRDDRLEFVQKHLARNEPVIVLWKPHEIVKSTYSKCHYGVICVWERDENCVCISDSYMRRGKLAKLRSLSLDKFQENAWVANSLAFAVCAPRGH